VILEGSQSVTALQAFYKLNGFDSRLFKNGLMSCSLRPQRTDKFSYYELLSALNANKLQHANCRETDWVYFSPIQNLNLLR
jgi:hypothetical protein